jgi:signal transduction histidine kinase
LAGYGFFWYRKRKQRLQWEKEMAIREERLQISQRVHDVVANGIYRVMTKIEHGGSVDRGDLLDELEPLYNQSRDISYEPAGSVADDFHTVISSLVTPYGTEDRKVVTMGKDEIRWTAVGARTKEALRPILQELMVNMDKHSQAHNVLVRFEQEGERLTLCYQDDGVGFPADLYFGNGLTNTGNRILGIGGEITFERNTPTGARIRIYLPNA